MNRLGCVVIVVLLVASAYGKPASKKRVSEKRDVDDWINLMEVITSNMTLQEVLNSGKISTVREFGERLKYDIDGALYMIRDLSRGDVFYFYGSYITVDHSFFALFHTMGKFLHELGFDRCIYNELPKKPNFVDECFCGLQGIDLQAAFGGDVHYFVNYIARHVLYCMAYGFEVAREKALFCIDTDGDVEDIAQMEVNIMDIYNILWEFQYLIGMVEGVWNDIIVAYRDGHFMYDMNKIVHDQIDYDALRCSTQYGNANNNGQSATTPPPGNANNNGQSATTPPPGNANTNGQSSFTSPPPAKRAMNDKDRVLNEIVRKLESLKLKRRSP